MIFWRCTIFRLAKPAFFRYNENFTLGCVLCGAGNHGEERKREATFLSLSFSPSHRTLACARALHSPPAPARGLTPSLPIALCAKKKIRKVCGGGRRPKRVFQTKLDIDQQRCQCGRNFIWSGKSRRFWTYEECAFQGNSSAQFELNLPLVALRGPGCESDKISMEIATKIFHRKPVPKTWPGSKSEGKSFYIRVSSQSPTSILLSCQWPVVFWSLSVIKWLRRGFGGSMFELPENTMYQMSTNAP